MTTTSPTEAELQEVASLLTEQPEVLLSWMQGALTLTAMSCVLSMLQRSVERAVPEDQPEQRAKLLSERFEQAGPDLAETLLQAVTRTLEEVAAGGGELTWSQGLANRIVLHMQTLLIEVVNNAEPRA